MRSRRAWRSSPTTSPTSTPPASSAPRGVRGPAVPEPAPGRRRDLAGHAAADGPAARHRRARRRDREELHAGQSQQTGNALDVAINGRGFFQVLMPDGTTAYTRDGSFQIERAGPARHHDGYPVQPGISIPAGAQSVTIGSDGTVSVQRRRPGRADAGRPAAARRTSSIPPACSRAARTLCRNRRQRSRADAARRA